MFEWDNDFIMEMVCQQHRKAIYKIENLYYCCIAIINAIASTQRGDIEASWWAEHFYAMRIVFVHIYSLAWYSFYNAECSLEIQFVEYF